MRRLIAAGLLLLAVPAAAQPVVTRYNYNEGSNYKFPITFRDDAGAPVTPSAATYRIVTLAGTELVATTAITPLASSVEVPVAPITFPAGELVVGNARLPVSVPMAFVVTYTWGAAQQRIDWYWGALLNAPAP